jgi:hypothetical protein
LYQMLCTGFNTWYKWGLWINRYKCPFSNSSLAGTLPRSTSILLRLATSGKCTCIAYIADPFSYVGFCDNLIDRCDIKLKKL